jgi:hypothetical protein
MGGRAQPLREIENLVVPCFEPAKMIPGSTCFMIGKRGTGKTKLIVDLMAYFRHVSYCVVICPTIEAEATYAKHVPAAFIHRNWSPKIVDDMLAAQLALGKGVAECPALLIFDDCLFDPKFAKDISTRNLYMNGRHANITVICAGQYMLDLPPAIRTNTDYVFVLADNNKTNREKIYKNFGGVFRTFNSFNEVMMQCTTDYHCLVLDNKTTSNALAECVAHYCATLDLVFKVGSDALWEYTSEGAPHTALSTENNASNVVLSRFM